MKKKWLLVVSVLVAVLAVAGCSSTPKVYDPSVPLDQSCTLVLDNDAGIIELNNKKVALMGSIIIPADHHNWIMRYKEKEFAGAQLTKITQYDIVMSYKFLPEHTYYVTATTSGCTATGQIKDITNLYLDFPSPDPTSPDASPIEGKWNFSADGKNTDVLVFVKNEYARIVNGTYFERGFVEDNGKIFTLVVCNI